MAKRSRWEEDEDVDGDDAAAAGGPSAVNGGAAALHTAPAGGDRDADPNEDAGRGASHKMHSLVNIAGGPVPIVERCRDADCYEKLNKIDEGTYGIVYRCRERATGDIVALKQIKLHKGLEGFPATSLREISILLSLDHPNIINVREVVVGNGADKVFMVMAYMEHDLKALMGSMRHPFSLSEAKCLLLQLLRATAYMHDHWVIHRDLKTSNLLFSNRGVLTVCDFGMARRYGEPIQEMTAEVVTLWYRAPEILLGQRKYTPAVDMWSVGCIFAEIITMKALLPGQGELDQLERTFKLLGTPNDDIWPGYSELPNAKNVRWRNYPYNRLKDTFRVPKFAGGPMLTDNGLDLLNRMLCYDPSRRITAAEALEHNFFREDPPAKAIALMPTYPSKQS